MALNPNYIIAPSLQQYFVDKNSGEPLAAGTIYFWSDVNRATPKPVFTISGSPPNYSYVNIGSVINISGVGTFTDNAGNDILPYYYPYDSDGNVELYFVQVFDANNVSQFTREAWPNIFPEMTGDQGLDITNYIPNGQFLLHNNIPANILTGIPAGQITTPVTNIAEGGWTFERPSGSTATDNVSFLRRSSYLTNPTGSPRYSLNVACLGAAPSDAFKNICVKFNDVNKFASDSQVFTFTFSAMTNGGVNIPVTLYMIKNFGTGGSPQTTTTITTLTITNVEQIFSIPFIVGNNTGKNIGSLDDDFMQIAIGLPTNITFNGLFDDVSYVIGSVDVTVFPEQTNSDFIARSMVPPVPDYNGFTLGLPIIQTSSGYGYDYSQIGKVYNCIYATPQFGELLCDGSTYRTSAYSSDGIPYARLQQALINFTPLSSGLRTPLCGTGDNFVTASICNAATSIFFIINNTPSIEGNITDGSVATGFTFNTVSPGYASYSTYGLQCFLYGNCTTFWALNINPGTNTTDSQSSAAISINSYPVSADGEIVGTSAAQQMQSVSVNGIPAAGSYIQIARGTSVVSPWFTFNGAGSAPSSPNLLRVNLFSNMDVGDIAAATAASTNGQRVAIITCVAGNVLTPNSYFTFTSKGQLYYVWYSLNGTGTDPAISSGIGIPVTYTASSSAQAIMGGTVTAINNMFFKVPDLRGYVIKGWDPSGANDLNWAYRYFPNGGRFGDPNLFDLPGYIGSYQKDVLLSHTHDWLMTISGTPSGSPFTQNSANNAFSLPNLSYADINPYGTGQNDVKNIYLNYVIKY